tara:strand:- start:261 stop:860 length:600 start_codon:yes stop_codon:yes gene_type:complete
MQLTIGLSYLSGALRDGSILRYYGKGKKTYHSITIYNKSVIWLEYLKKLINKELKKEPNIYFPKERTPYVRLYSKEKTEQLGKLFQHPMKTQTQWKTPNCILQSKNQNIHRNYIAGFFDAEGSFDRCTKQIRFHQSLEEPLISIKRILKMQFNINTGNVCKYKNANGKLPRFVLRILKKDNEIFLRVIPIKNRTKINNV